MLGGFVQQCWGSPPVSTGETCSVHNTGDHPGGKGSAENVSSHQNKKSHVEKCQTDPLCHLRMALRQIRQNEGIPVWSNIATGNVPFKSAKGKQPRNLQQCGRKPVLRTQAIAIARNQNPLLYTWGVSLPLAQLSQPSAKTETRQKKSVGLDWGIPGAPGPSPAMAAEAALGSSSGAGVASGRWALGSQHGCQAPLSPTACVWRELPGDVIYSVRLNPSLVLRVASGVAVARNTISSRKGWLEPGSWQWGIKPITDLDVIQSKPPSSRNKSTALRILF